MTVCALTEGPGSARVSRVGDSVLAIADFVARDLQITVEKACCGETPQPTRETRALPR